MPSRNAFSVAKEPCFIANTHFLHSVSSIRNAPHYNRNGFLQYRPRQTAVSPRRINVTAMVAPKLDDKKIVTDYFNSTGFDRWNRIYSESGTVNSVQEDIRNGHAETVKQILEWFPTDNTSGTVCDAGCGVGSLALPLAARGLQVTASDISSAMVEEAGRRAHRTLGEKAGNVTFAVSDLEMLSGEYDTVCCVDVMIHYPTEDAAKMIEHLSGLAKRRLIISFAPKTFVLSILKKIGEFFPGPSKATRAYLHSEEDVRAALKRCGMTVRRTGFTSTKFYFSKIVEAVKE